MFVYWIFKGYFVRYGVCGYSNSHKLVVKDMYMDGIAALSNYDPLNHEMQLSPWRNWLARSAVNRKVGGSSPPGDCTCFLCMIISTFKKNEYDLF